MENEIVSNEIRKMFHAYILLSLKDGTYYYGHAENVRSRLREHNDGRQKFTKSHRLYVIHYFEEFETRKEAAARERFFKSIDGYRWLREKQIIK